jgi:hypothetical protein
MKVDVEIKFTDKVDLALVGGKKNALMTYDEDYCEDFDDVIDYVEEEMYKKYGFAFHYKVDFEIENAAEICDELERKGC